jgi:hypothetical protein
MGAGTTGTGEGGVSSSGRGETRSTEENHDQYRMQREVSLSAADEDAALTLLSARHMGGGQASRPLAWPERQSSDSSAQQQPNQQQSGRSKRIPKPKLRHKNDIGGFEQYSYRRHHHAGGRSATHGQTKKLEQMERHLASITIGKKAGEPVDMDDILLRHGNGTTSAFDLEPISNDFTTVVNLADYSQQDLKGMARKSGQHSMPPTLQPLPGVPMEKVATFSGQDLFYKSSIQSHYRPSRTSRSILSPDVLKSDEERKAVAEKIVEKWRRENHEVWKLLGRQDPPVVNRVQINYLRLTLVVEEFGGYDVALQNKEWSNIARRFHMDEGNIGKNGHSLRMLYLQYIKPLIPYLAPHLQGVHS